MKANKSMTGSMRDFGFRPARRKMAVRLTELTATTVSGLCPVGRVRIIDRKN